MNDNNTLRVSRHSLSDRKDPRIVFGANCVWWDSIDKAGRMKPELPLPCCPYCKSVLMEIPNIEAWNESVDHYEAKGHPGYRAFVDWMRGKCFRSSKDAQAAYALEGGEVDIGERKEGP